MQSKYQDGISLPIALAFLLLASIMGVSAIRTASLEEKKSRIPADKLVAQASAHAALQDAIKLLNPAYDAQTGVQNLDFRGVPQILGPWDGTSEISVTASTASSAVTLPTRDNYATTTFTNAVCATAFGHPGGCPATSLDSAWYSYGYKPASPGKGSAPEFIFKSTCDGGLCLNNGSTTDPWSNILNQATTKRINYGAKTSAIALTGVSQQPYYIIEYLANKSSITETFDGTDRKTLANSVPLTYPTVYTATPSLFKSKPPGSSFIYTEERPGSVIRNYASATRGADNSYTSNILRRIPSSNFKNIKTCWDTFGYWSASGLQCTYATSFAGTTNQAMLDGAKDDGRTRSGYGTSGVTALDTLKSWEGTSATQTTFGALDKTNFILSDGGLTTYHHEKDIECSWTARNRNNFELGATGDVIRGFPSCLSISTKNNWGNITNELVYLRPNHEYKSRYRITAVGFGAVNAKVILQQEVYLEAMRWGGLTTTEAGLTSSDTNYPAESCDEPDVLPVVTQTWNTTTRTWDVSVSYPTGWSFYGYPRASLVNMNTWGHAKQVFVPENVKCSHWLGRRTMLNADPEAPGSIGGIDPTKARYIYVRPRLFKAFSARRLY